jgi:hypothetical protein
VSDLAAGAAGTAALVAVLLAGPLAGGPRRRPHRVLGTALTAGDPRVAGWVAFVTTGVLLGRAHAAAWRMAGARPGAAAGAATGLAHGSLSAVLTPRAAARHPRPDRVADTDLPAPAEHLLSHVLYGAVTGAIHRTLTERHARC